MRRFLYLVVLLAIASGITLSISDPDFWWHAVVGRWIIAHHAVPWVEHWNEYAAGKPWIAYSWSNEVLYALVDRYGGPLALVGCDLALALLLCLSLAYCLGRVSGDYLFGLALTACAAAACSMHFELRPQTLSWITFVWILYLAEQCRVRGVHLRQALGLVLAAAVWANTHLSLVLGIGAGSLWLLEGPKLSSAVRQVLPFVILLLLGSLLTPYHGEEWLTFFTMADHPFAHPYIREFQPATLHHATADLVLLLFIVLSLLLHYKPNALRPAQVISGVIFVVAGFMVVKFIPFAAIMVVFLIAALWRSAGGEPTALGPLSEGLHRARARLVTLRTPAQIALIVGFLGLIAWNVHWLVLEPVYYSVFPVEAVNFIEKSNLPRPLLNDFNSGGYLIYRFSNADGTPREKVVMDGRTNVNDPRVVRGYLHALQGDLWWESLFDLVKPKTVLWPNQFPLVTILLQDPRWCQVFPTAEMKESSSGWSVFITREEFDKRRDEFHSRDCSQERSTLDRTAG